MMGGSIDSSSRHTWSMEGKTTESDLEEVYDLLKNSPMKDSTSIRSHPDNPATPQSQRRPTKIAKSMFAHTPSADASATNDSIYDKGIDLSNYPS